MIAAVRMAMISAYRTTCEIGMSFTLYHLRSIAKYPGHWRQCRSHDTCWACLESKPPYWLDCGHALCKNCVHASGQRHPLHSHVYRFVQCPYCDRAVDNTFRLPLEAVDINLLVLDGGGVRGSVTLEILTALEEKMGPLLHYAFDLVVGTSIGGSCDMGPRREVLTSFIGGIIALTYFSKGWAARQCSEVFDKIARVIFPKVGGGMAHRFISLYRLYLTHGVYPTAPFEAILKQVFGDEVRMAQNSSIMSTGTKIAVPAVGGMSRNQFHLFVNYSDVEARSRHCRGFINPLRCTRYD